MIENVTSPPVTVWDPFGDSVSSLSFVSQQKLLVDKLQKYRQNPGIFKKNLQLLTALPIVIIVIVILLAFPNNIGMVLNRGTVSIIIFSFFPLIFYRRFVIRFQDDLILYLLCENNHWIFNPAVDNNRFQLLQRVFPAVFNVGRSQMITDQIWGAFQAQEKVGFWRSTFTYTVGSGKNSHTYIKAVFVLRLSRQLPVSFKLSKAGLFSSFEDVVKTESADFNKLFQISSDQKDEAAKMQIIKILSPSVQVRLIDFIKNINFEAIYFQNNTITIIFPDEIWRPVYTNFFNQIAVDARDEALFMESLKQMVELPTEVINYID